MSVLHFFNLALKKSMKLLVGCMSYHATAKTTKAGFYQKESFERAYIFHFDGFIDKADSLLFVQIVVARPKNPLSRQ